MDDHQYMIENHLIRRGIKDKRVLQAMQLIKRKDFVPDKLTHHAYEDNALPIGYNQTISQPYVVAFMLERLQIQTTDIILEIGAGSGYQTALLCALVPEGHVFTIEYVKPLAELAAHRLLKYKFHNFTMLIQDGSEGCPRHAPYNKIIVSAASRVVSLEMLHQLCNKGLLIAPIGKPNSQRLFLYKNIDGEFMESPLFHVTFVPLVGKYSI